MDSSEIGKVAKRKISSESSSEEDCVYYEEVEESEPEQDCEVWDNETRIVETKLASLTGYHLMPTCNPNPNKKAKLLPEMRTTLLDADFKSSFQQAWNANRNFDNNGAEVVVDPFKVCVISDLLENLAFLNEVRQEFNDIDWNMRSMDLYEFFQSPDLKHLTEHYAINLIYKLLQNDVMKWVSELTGLNLSHISATCSVCSNTDYLLVHDDQREDRMVAFILYLPKGEWEESKGGALQLLSKDSDGQPSEIMRDIFPANNQFVFFPVASDSYHQVAEVTSLNDCRLSINGWFHTKTSPVFQTPNFKPYPCGLYGEKQLRPIDFDGDLTAWITEEYLENDIIEDVQKYFEENSEISLKNFLKNESFSELLEILQSDGLNWVEIGPPNRYRYEIVVSDDLPEVLDRFLLLFRSKQIFSLLRRYTDLELTQEKASMKFELQKWTPGCYSLLGDYGWYDKKELDLIINFGCKCNNDVIGGRTMYVTTDEQVQDALITLEPEENSLNLVYRDTARFTKYYSKQSRCRCFYTLICSYSE